MRHEEWRERRDGDDDLVVAGGVSRPRPFHLTEYEAETPQAAAPRKERDPRWYFWLGLAAFWAVVIGMGVVAALIERGQP